MSMTPEEFAKAIKDTKQKLMKQTSAIMLEVGFKGVKHAKRNFTKNDLKRAKNGGWIHKKTAASGYNVGPRSLTGNLRRSISAKLSVNKGDVLAHVTAGIKKPVKYAAAIEYGYPPKNILPRFYITRAVRAVAKKTPTILVDKITIALTPEI
tara:strand:- start:1827 stop:2282 length:456 start_codon:yes stop_codon:yes gene_type:complete